MSNFTTALSVEINKEYSCSLKRTVKTDIEMSFNNTLYTFCNMNTF